MRRALLALAVAGCAAAEALPAPVSVPPPAAPPAFELGLHPGETMAFEVRLAGMLAGEAQLAVGEIGVLEGRRAIVVRSRAATVGAAALLRKISDEATTVVDADTGHPISLTTVVELGTRRTLGSAKFAAGVADVTYQRVGEAAHALKIDYGDTPLFDAHSAMAQLRGWRAPVGAVRTVFVVGGRRLWRIDITFGGGDTIGTPAGNRRAVVYHGMSYRARRDLIVESNRPARQFQVWLSDDGDRVPLKVSAKTELGDITMDLVEYARP